jgi:hypothetical protein
VSHDLLGDLFSADDVAPAPMAAGPPPAAPTALFGDGAVAPAAAASEARVDPLLDLANVFLGGAAAAAAIAAAATEVSTTAATAATAATVVAAAKRRARRMQSPVEHRGAFDSVLDSVWSSLAAPKAAEVNTPAAAAAAAAADAERAEAASAAAGAAAWDEGVFGAGGAVDVSELGPSASAARAEAAWGEDVFGGGESTAVSGDVVHFSDAAFVIDSSAAVGGDAEDDVWDESVFSGGSSARVPAAATPYSGATGEFYMYRYISRESSSQFDSLPLTYFRPRQRSRQWRAKTSLLAPTSATLLRLARRTPAPTASPGGRMSSGESLE